MQLSPAKHDSPNVLAVPSAFFRPLPTPSFWLAAGTGWPALGPASHRKVSLSLERTSERASESASVRVIERVSERASERVSE